MLILGKLNEAIAELDKLLKIDPKNNLALSSKEKALKKIKKGQQNLNRLKQIYVLMITLLIFRFSRIFTINELK